VPDLDGDEPDGRDEAICPADMGDDGHNLIIDDEIHAVFDGIPPAAHVVFVTDSCHSGTVFRMFNPAEGRTAYRRPRVIPPSHFLKTDALLRKMDRAFGQPVTRTNAPLSGVVHFSGCKDTETSCDAEINGRACGAFSFYATRAFGRGAALGQSYADVHAIIRKSLPSYDFQQTPLLNAPPALKKARVFGVRISEPGYASHLPRRNDHGQVNPTVQ
jgi:hypothetical protein